MREHFDRLIDRINAHEVTALAQGDGFAEKRYEAAPIDEILKNATTFAAPPADAATKAAVKADLEHNPHDIPIPEHPKVLSYVEVFQGRMREYIQDSLVRGAKYMPMIQSVFRAEGLPLDLAYIPIIESSFKTNALSKASAKGPWQFMKPTAKEHGLKTDWFIDERSDPEKATIAAAKYLKSLSDMFDGDWNMVLAAYNGGPGRVSRAIKRSGVNDFWQLSASTKYLPRETREYVPLILAAIIIGRNPAQYGFEAITAEPIGYDKVRCRRPWTCAASPNGPARRWTRSRRSIRNCAAGRRRSSIRSTKSRSRKGRRTSLNAKLADASPADFSAFKWYTAKKGETLLTVARRFGVSRTDVAEANNLTAKARLRPGQELIIPRAPATLLAARAERAGPDRRRLARRSRSRPRSPPSTTPAKVAHVTYKVKRGDTLFSIAQLFDTTVAKIKSWNRLTSNRISAGAKLTILATRVR